MARIHTAKYGLSRFVIYVKYIFFVPKSDREKTSRGFSLNCFVRFPHCDGFPFSETLSLTSLCVMLSFVRAGTVKRVTPISGLQGSSHLCPKRTRRISCSLRTDRKAISTATRYYNFRRLTCTLLMSWTNNFCRFVTLRRTRLFGFNYSAIETPDSGQCRKIVSQKLGSYLMKSYDAYKKFSFDLLDLVAWAWATL